MTTDESSTQSVDEEASLNILGSALEACCFEPMTGFYRDGFCKTGVSDAGTHTVCALMTEEFLDYTKARGNDLSTPQPHFGFPGLVPGDKWCLCASRWLQAQKAGYAPPVVLKSTHAKTLSLIELDVLRAHQVQ